MADLPDYVTVLFAGYGESFDPSVMRTEMERGAPKQALMNSQVLMKLQVSLLFRSKTDAANFETWYFDTIKRIGSFNMLHPRTKASIVASFEGGSIGQLLPMGPQFAPCRRDCIIEYLR